MPTRIVSLFLTVSILVLLGSVSVAEAQNRTTSGTASLNETGTVVVDNHEGRITVRTWGRAEVQYEAVVRPESGADHPEATTVRVDRSESRFTIRTEYDESKENGDDGPVDWFGGDNQNVMPVEYTLTVPRGARVEIDDHESKIQVQGLDGPVGIATHDGEITLTNQGGDANLESHDGPIRVENQSGALTIDTHESDVQVDSVSGPVEIDAHDSEVEIQGLRGGLKVDMHEGSGRFAVAELTGDVTIDTHDGNFTLALPAGTGFDLRTDFDDDDAGLQADFDLSPYRLSAGDEDDEVNYAGSVNGGGPRVSLSSQDGDFELRTQ